MHSFTNLQADKAMIPGVAYNAKAAERAWEAMKVLFAETIGNEFASASDSAAESVGNVKALVIP